MFYLSECLAESSAAYLMWSSLLQDLLRIVGRKVLTSHIAFLVTEALLLHVVLFSLRRRKNVGIKFLKKNNSVSFRSSMHLSSTCKLCTDRRISSLIYTFQGTFKQLMSIRSEAYSGKRRGELTNKQN